MNVLIKHGLIAGEIKMNLKMNCLMIRNYDVKNVQKNQNFKITLYN